MFMHNRNQSDIFCRGRRSNSHRRSKSKHAPRSSLPNLQRSGGWPYRKYKKGLVQAVIGKKRKECSYIAWQSGQRMYVYFPYARKKRSPSNFLFLLLGAPKRAQSVCYPRAPRPVVSDSLSKHQDKTLRHWKRAHPFRYLIHKLGTKKNKQDKNKQLGNEPHRSSYRIHSHRIGLLHQGPETLATLAHAHRSDHDRLNCARFSISITSREILTIPTPPVS